ncbi:MAG: hypothetical protein EXQ58_07195 [Acidobacteria bacterium]|nr:hypothetical protein [Acidobacteriota bacterium]
MALSGFGTKQPDWVPGLPKHIQLTDDQIRRLEAIREEAGVPSQEFELHIASHPECSKMIQREIFAAMKAQSPGTLDELLLAYLIHSRLLSAVFTGEDLFGMGRYAFLNSPEPSPDALRAILDFMRARELLSLERLLHAIAEDEDRLATNVQPAPHMSDTVRKITAVLSHAN